MKLAAILKMIRLPNLFLIALTMIFFRYFVIIPILKFSGSISALSHFNFFLVVSSVLFIAAGGYAINDYYDVEIDRINKPEKIIVGRYLSEESAYWTFHLLSFTGILIAFYLSFFAKIPMIGIIHLACALSLWLYAAYLKRILLIGNLVISLLCSFVLFITVYYDPVARKAEPILYLLAGYSLFAFIMSFIRELIKDLEDVKGDAAMGCKTLAVSAGSRITKIFICAFIIITIFLLGFIQYLQFQSADFISMAYVGVLMQIPLLLLFYRLIKSNEAKALHFCSLLCKLIMLTGVLSMPVFYLAFS
jgi:4-hydroxybenzoate polyprenyltransferase